MACCPAHEDKSPSMRVTQRDGKILLHCMAGCVPDDILAAIGLRWSDLFDDQQQAAYNAAVAQRTRLPAINQFEHERTIIRLAVYELKQGRTLSIEDQSRVKIAMERVRSTMA
jgi:hypothetical protein